MNRLFALTLLAGLIGPFFLFSVSRSVNAIKYGGNSSSFDVGTGKNIFSARCSRCHMTTGQASSIGPNLSRIGTAAAKRRPGLSAAGYLLESVLAPEAFKSPGSSGEMPKHLLASVEDKDVRNLVAFLNSLGGTPNDSDIGSLVIERPPKDSDSIRFSKEEVLRGEVIYRGKGGCVACHPFHGGSEYEFTSPYLFYRGYRNGEQLRIAITSPHIHVAEKYQQASVALSDGTVLTGNLIRRDDSTVAMMVNKNGTTTSHIISVEDIERDDENSLMIKRIDLSTMPSGIEQRLSQDEMNCLLAFILSLN